jgi:hypothetical protein
MLDKLMSQGGHEQHVMTMCTPFPPTTTWTLTPHNIDTCLSCLTDHTAQEEQQVQGLAGPAGRFAHPMDGGTPPPDSRPLTLPPNIHLSVKTLEEKLHLLQDSLLQPKELVYLLVGLLSSMHILNNLNEENLLALQGLGENLVSKGLTLNPYALCHPPHNLMHCSTQMVSDPLPTRTTCATQMHSQLLPTAYSPTS